MAQFIPFDEKVEVNGRTVLSIKKGMGAFADVADEIFTEHGLGNVKEDGWYPMKLWLDCFKQISEEIGDKTLFQIGQKIPESAEFPPQINDAHGAIQSIDVAYHMNHRGGEIGSYIYSKLSETSAKVDCPNPYPCEFDKGIILAMARRFQPNARVTHEPGSCRKEGSNTCVYKVEW
jgi:hypothetical protein